MATSTAPASPALAPATSREIFAWVMYDWANSAYSTLLITIVMLFLTTVVLPGNPGTLAYTWGIGVSTLFAAVLAPVIGAMADARANKRFWLMAAAFTGAGASILMSFVPVGNAWLTVGLFVLANLGFELSFAMYCAFLPEISTEETVNRISAWGFGAGYVGGGLALAVALAVVLGGGYLGLPDADAEAADFHATRDGAFAVALPDGPYDVSILLGDPTRARNQMQVTFGGDSPETVSTAKGETKTIERSVNVTGGRLDLHFKSLGDDEVAIGGIRIQNAAGPVAKLDLGPAGMNAPEGFAVVAATLSEPTLPTLELPAPTDSNEERATINAGWTQGVITSAEVIQSSRLRMGVALMGIWWFVFSLPAAFYLRDHAPPKNRHLSVPQAAKQAFGNVVGTLKNVRSYRMLFLFMIGYLLYNDGVQTVISSAPIFAREVLNMGVENLITMIFVLQFAAVPGTLLISWLSDRWGQKQTLYLCLAIWVGLLIAAFFVKQSWQFWIMAGVLALVMGGVQSVSRAIMGVMTPVEKSGEFFGFFNFSGRATSMVGPPLFGTVLVYTGSAHWALLSLLIFFIIGWAFISRVDIDQGRVDAERAAA
jgi:MFS-type transporter involved in bile tolerance (Atg22 family)